VLAVARKREVSIVCPRRHQHPTIAYSNAMENAVNESNGFGSEELTLFSTISLVLGK
jgi:hypothetical protein